MRIQVLILSLTLCLSASARAQTAQPGPAPATASSARTGAAETPVVQASPVFEGATPNPVGISVWGALPWGGWGVGGRFMMPLPISPVLHAARLRDSWALEFGVDYLHLGESFGPIDFHYNVILPVVGIMWNFWVSQRFAFYPKVEGGYQFTWLSGSYATNITGIGGVFVSGAGGVMYKMENGLTLRAELGISGAKAGVGWLF